MLCFFVIYVRIANLSTLGLA